MSSPALPPGHPWTAQTPSGAWVDPTPEERAAYDRLRAAGGGDPIAGDLPPGDPYRLIMYGWGDAADRNVGRVWAVEGGRRALMVDHSTALVSSQPDPAPVATAKEMPSGLADELAGLSEADRRVAERVAALPELEPAPGHEERAVERAKREGVLPRT